MNTFTLGLIVIAYLLSLAYLGFLGYKKTTNTSDYLVGGRQMNRKPPIKYPYKKESL